jgi:site-specific DNA-cytosine methylase
MASAVQLVRLPLWTEDIVWQSHVTSLCNVPAGLSVLELCAGAGTAYIALKLLLGEGRVRLAGAWDTNLDLKVLHEGHNGAASCVHLGPVAGDIIATDLEQFPSANIVVAGPPCPPFSACGSRHALEDPRARPFERCMEVISELNSRSKSLDSAVPELMFFILENVPGIAFRNGQNCTSALDTLLSTLRKNMGPAWIVHTVQLNALRYGLPQNRERVYIIGRKGKFYSHDALSGPPPFHRQVRPAELLNMSDKRPAQVTVLQAMCFKEWKKVHAASMEDPANRGKVAFVEMHRDPTPRTAWGGTGAGANARTDRCQCLRASGPGIQVFALGEGHGQLSLDRPLRIAERGALQGFPDNLCNLPLSEVAGRRVWGNAMAVPVLGSVLAHELICIQDSITQSAWAHAIATPTLPAGTLLPAAMSLGQQPLSSGCASSASSQPHDGAAAVRDPDALASIVEEEVKADVSEDSDDILPGQRAAAVAWAGNIAKHFAEGKPGRAARPLSSLSPGDCRAMEKRRRRGQTGSSCGSSHPGSPANLATSPSGSVTDRGEAAKASLATPPAAGRDESTATPALLAMQTGQLQEEDLDKEDMPMFGFAP